MGSRRDFFADVMRTSRANSDWNSWTIIT